MGNGRNTLQREIVLDEVSKMCGHATVGTIYEKIHKFHPSISKATVYRNLNVLQKEGKIMRIQVPDGADYFEALKKDHYHIKCVSCGQVFDASLPYMPQLFQMAKQTEKNFSLFNYTLLFEGICPDCLNHHNKEEKNYE